MSNVRAMFVGEDAADAQAKHEAKMREHREQRANLMNIVFGVLAFVACILILVGGICAAALLVRAAF